MPKSFAGTGGEFVQGSTFNVDERKRIINFFKESFGVRPEQNANKISRQFAVGSWQGVL
jgi:hypothetical protein